MLIGRLKGGIGSGHFGHKGIPGHQGGSLPRGVLSSRSINDLNIPGCAYGDPDLLADIKSVDLFNKLVTHMFGKGIVPRQTLDDKQYGTYVISPDGDILQAEDSKASHTQIQAYLALSKPLDFVDEDTRLRATNILYTARDEDEIIESLFLKAGYVDVRSITPTSYAIKFAGDINKASVRRILNLIDAGKIPSNASGTFSLYSIDKNTRAIRIPAAELDLIAGFRPSDSGSSYELVPILKEYIEKGGAGSGFHGHKGRPGLEGGSVARGVLSSQVSRDLIQQANRTSRNTGAVGAKAIVPRYVETIAKPSDTILDFGAGKAAAHAIRLQSSGLNVTPYEFGDNSIAGVHNADALSKKYSIVYASNVLNVQGSEDMLNNTLEQLINAVNPGGRLIVNLPDSPRYGAWEGLSSRQGADKLQSILMDKFEKVIRVGGTASAPLFEASKLRTRVNKELVLKGGLGSGFYNHRGRPGLEGGSTRRGVLPSSYRDIKATVLNSHTDESESDPPIKNPFEKPPLGWGHYLNTNKDKTAAYIAAWGKNEDAKQSDYHPESQVHMWIDPKVYFNPLTASGNVTQLVLENLEDETQNSGLAQLMKDKIPLDAVWYDIDINTGNVQNQEGRHRAFVAMQLGIKQIPLIIFFKNSDGKAVDISKYSEAELLEKNPFSNLMKTSEKYGSTPLVWFAKNKF